MRRVTNGVAYWATVTLTVVGIALAGVAPVQAAPPTPTAEPRFPRGSDPNRPLPAPTASVKQDPEALAEMERIWKERPAQEVDAQLLAPKRTFAEFSNAVFRDVNAFWSQYFRAAGRSYPSPRWLIYSQPIRTCAGNVVSRAQNRRAVGSHYCGGNSQTIFLDLWDVQNLWRRWGDFAVASLIAHEVSHHVQFRLGLRLRAPFFELQADCLAGVWARSTLARRLLENGDLNEALTFWFNYGGDAAHGAGQQRRTSYYRGYFYGRWNVC